MNGYDKKVSKTDGPENPCIGVQHMDKTKDQDSARTSKTLETNPDSGYDENV